MNHLHLGVIASLLIGLALQDVVQRKLANIGVLAVFGTALAGKLWTGGFAAVALDSFALVGTFAGGLVLFRWGAVGGGDVKLLGVCAFTVGVGDWLALCLWTAIGGGVIAVLYVSGHVITGAWQSRSAGRDERRTVWRLKLPYGVAISSATVLLLWSQTGIAWFEGAS